MFSADDLLDALAEQAPPNVTGYVIALSGGADSGALLAAASELRGSFSGLSLRAVHVNHGLQSAAVQFEEICRGACERFDIPLTVVRAHVPAHGGSLEAAARDARYAALCAQLRGAECLLTAHHCQDQAETFLLQALRGAGIKGLAAMPVRRRFGSGWHLRPLLAVDREELHEYGATRGVCAVNDPMNGDVRFERAYLRRELWPQIARRWPAAAAVLTRASAHVAQALEALQGAAQQDLAAVRDGDALSLQRLRRLAPPRQIAVLREFVRASGARLPSERRIGEALRQMLRASQERNPVVAWDNHALRRYRDRIFLGAAKIDELTALQWRWHNFGVCELGAGLGRLRVVDRLGGLDPGRLPPVLDIRARRGGETLNYGAGGMSKSVRQLYQELGVLPWMRFRIPFIHAPAGLLAVADLWLDARARCAASERGIAFAWDDAPVIS